MKQPIPMIYRPSQSHDNTMLPPGRFVIVYVTGQRDGGYLGRISEVGAIADLERNWIHGGDYFPESKIMAYRPEAWAECQEYNRQADEIIEAYNNIFERLKKQAKKKPSGQLPLL